MATLVQEELALAERGMDDAAAHAGDEHAEAIRRCTLAIAEDRGDDGFTADDVRSRVPMRTFLAIEQSPNVMGAVFRRLAKSRLIERAPDKAPRLCNHKGARGRMLTVWRLFTGEA